MREWMRNDSRRLVHDSGVWQVSHSGPISPRCASRWQSLQAVATSEKTRLWWQSRQPAWACAATSGNPVPWWSKSTGLRSGDQPSAVWQVAQSPARSPCGLWAAGGAWAVTRSGTKSSEVSPAPKKKARRFTIALCQAPSRRHGSRCRPSQFHCSA